MENIDEVLCRVAEDRESVSWDWSKRCEQYVGTWMPADHLYFLHGSEDVKQDHYVTIARSNAYGLQNDVDGVVCPSIDTPEGMDAKRLANTYAHGRNVTCEVISNFGAAWRGDCKLKSNNGNTLSQTLIDSGLCKSGKIIMDCGIVQRLLGWCE